MCDVPTFKVSFNCEDALEITRIDIAALGSNTWNELPGWVLREGGITAPEEWDESDWETQADRHNAFMERWNGGLLAKTARLGLSYWSRRYRGFRDESPIPPVFDLASEEQDRNKENPSWDRDMERFIRFLPAILDANDDPGTIFGIMIDLEKMECSSFASDRRRCVIEKAVPENLLSGLPAGQCAREVREASDSGQDHPAAPKRQKRHRAPSM